MYPEIYIYIRFDPQNTSQNSLVYVTMIHSYSQRICGVFSYIILRYINSLVIIIGIALAVAMTVAMAIAIRLSVTMTIMRFNSSFSRRWASGGDPVACTKHYQSHRPPSSCGRTGLWGKVESENWSDNQSSIEQLKLIKLWIDLLSIKM